MAHTPTSPATRLSELRKTVEYRDPRALGAAVLKLFTRYRSETSKAEIASYVDALSGFPVWAAIKACDSWPTRKYDPEASLVHPPTAAQLIEAAKEESGWALRELERLEAAGGRNTRYRRAEPGEKTVGELEEEEIRRETGVEAWRPPTDEEKARADRLVAELKAKVAAEALDGLQKLSGAELLRSMRYGEIANQSRRNVSQKHATDEAVS